MKELITAKELCFWIQGYVNGCSIGRDPKKDSKDYYLSKEEFEVLTKKLAFLMDNA